VCDDGNLDGCKNDCTGPNADYSCSGGNSTSPSICTCLMSNSQPSGSTCSCVAGFSLVAGQCSPICGNGLLHGSETCDDGGIGCLLDCSGAKENFTCTGGSSSTPTLCSCIAGLSLQGGICIPKCKDGLVFGTEICDDGEKLQGCKEDCSGPNPDFVCTKGSTIAPSVCKCKFEHSVPSKNICVCDPDFILVKNGEEKSCLKKLTEPT
jgi:hypothetical protein